MQFDISRALNMIQIAPQVIQCKTIFQCPVKFRDLKRHLFSILIHQAVQGSHTTNIKPQISKLLHKYKRTDLYLCRLITKLNSRPRFFATPDYLVNGLSASVCCFLGADKKAEPGSQQ